MVINISVQYNGGFLPDTILITLCHNIGEPFQYHDEFLKKNLNAPRPSEHPQSVGKISRGLDWIIGCKDKTSSWHLNGLSDGGNIGSIS